MAESVQAGHGCQVRALMSPRGVGDDGQALPKRAGAWCRRAAAAASAAAASAAAASAAATLGLPANAADVEDGRLEAGTASSSLYTPQAQRWRCIPCT